MADKNNRFVKMLKQHRANLIYILVVLFLLVFFMLAKNSKSLANCITKSISYPIRTTLAVICSIFKYSVAEWMIILLAIYLIVFIILFILALFKNKDNLLNTIFCYLKNIISVSLTITMFVELLLNVPYYSDSFQFKSGLLTEESNLEQLYNVTVVFADKLSAVSPLVKRDTNGIYCEDIDDVFSDSPSAFRNIEELYPFLKGKELLSKKVRFSKALSIIETTGVAFPLTGEANINIDQPASSIPSTIAHEIAHQRGVTSEKEANFVAILACDVSGKTAYMYSGYMMAYSYLVDALAKENYELFLSIHASLPEDVKRDFHNEYIYWEKYDTKVSEYSDNLYDSFLKSQGQDLGTKSYGAVIDLLIAYYS